MTSGRYGLAWREVERLFGGESASGLGAGPLLERIAYLGQYAKSDTKSVTFRFTLYAPDRTLASEEVTQVRANVIDGMRGLGYDLTV